MPTPAPITEKIKEATWALTRAVGQSLADLPSIYTPILASDRQNHYLRIPAVVKYPRVAADGLSAQINAIDLYDINDFASSDPSKQLEQGAGKNITALNAASFSYGGFGTLEPGAIDVIEESLIELPFMSLYGTELLTETFKREVASFLGMRETQLVGSGYGMNLAAFPAIANYGHKLGKKTLLLMDSDNHNSMFVGAFIARDVKIVKFKHNDATDLGRKLASVFSEGSEFEGFQVWVAMEGIYSMDGSIAPLPQIIGLKQKYPFKIYIDEAHSFLALGSQGRGIVQHFTDSGHKISSADIDIIGATFSKSAGCIGASLSTHDAAVASAVRDRITEMKETGGDELPSLVKVRVLQIIRKPILVEARLRNLRRVAAYITKGLKDAGLEVLSEDGSPTVTFLCWTLRNVVEFQGAAIRLGLAAIGGGPPACPVWEAKIRLTLTALLTLDDAEQVVQRTVAACLAMGLLKRNLRVASSADLVISDSLQDGILNDESLIANESEKVDQTMLDLISSQIQRNNLANSHPHSPSEHKSQIQMPIPRLAKEVISEGIDALYTHGLGAQSARWFYGTHTKHLHLEKTLSSLYPMLNRAVGRVSAMMYPDARNAIFSTLAASFEGLAAKGQIHAVLIPREQHPAEGQAEGQRVGDEEESGISCLVSEAIRSRKAEIGVRYLYYDTPNQITALLRDLAPEHTTGTTTVYTTLFAKTADREGVRLDLEACISAISRAQTPAPIQTQIQTQTQMQSQTMRRGQGVTISGMTLLLDDTPLFGKSGPHNLGFLDTFSSPSSPSPPSSLSEESLPEETPSFSQEWLSKTISILNKPTRIIITGSFSSSFGLQGGYAIGSYEAIQSLSWNSRAYMFATSPMPFNAAMIDRAIRLHLERHVRVERVEQRVEQRVEGMGMGMGMVGEKGVSVSENEVEQVDRLDIQVQSLAA